MSSIIKGGAMDIKYIGNNLAKLRVSRGFTQEQLGKYIGLTPSAISNIEKSSSYPSVDTLIKIAIFFGVTLDYLSSDLNENELDELHFKSKLLTAEMFLKSGKHQKCSFEIDHKKYSFEEKMNEISYKVTEVDR